MHWIISQTIRPMTKCPRSSDLWTNQLETKKSPSTDDWLFGDKRQELTRLRTRRSTGPVRATKRLTSAITNPT